MPPFAEYLTVSLFACAFFAVLFFQSGFDKVFDRAGNLSWMEPHFEKSPFRGRVPILLTLITILELGAALSCLAGVADLLFGSGLSLPLCGMSVASLALLALFAGQRIAKDYAGAASLAAYFAVALIGLASA